VAPSVFGLVNCVRRGYRWSKGLDLDEVNVGEHIMCD